MPADKYGNHGVADGQPCAKLGGEILGIRPVDGQPVKNRLYKHIVAGVQQYGWPEGLRPNTKVVGQNGKAHNHNEKAKERQRNIAVVVVGKDDKWCMVEEPDDANDKVDGIFREKPQAIYQY